MTAHTPLACRKPLAWQWAAFCVLLLAGVAVAAKPKPATTGDAKDPSAVHDLKPIKLTPINVSTGVPPFLLAGDDVTLTKSGLRGALRTKAHDFLTKDFTLDVYIRFDTPEDQSFSIGIGEPTPEAAKEPTSVTLKWQRSGTAEMLGISADIRKPWLPDKTDQVLFRVEKAGDAATFWVACRAHGAYKVVVNQKIADLPHAAKFLTAKNARLFFGGQAIVTSVGLNVSETAPAKPEVATSKPEKPEKPAPEKPSSEKPQPEKPQTEKPSPPPTEVANPPAPQTRPVAAIDRLPLIPLGSVAGGLPSWLRVNPHVLADPAGLLEGETRTVSNELYAHDFVFDLVFKFADERDPSSFLIGLGENGRNGGWVTNSLAVRVGGPADGGKCSFGTREQDSLDKELGAFGHSPGPHLFRLESRAGTLTMSVSPDYKGTYDPIFSKTLLEFRHKAPFLSRVNGGIFFAGDHENHDERYDKLRYVATRLMVDGKAVENKTPPLPDAHDELVDKTPLVSLAGQAGLPPGITASAKALAGPDGIRGGELRTTDHNLIAQDWTFDLLYQFKSEQDQSIFLIGIGDNGRNGGWITNTICSRVHGPGHGGLATVTTPDLQSREPALARAGRVLGPNLFRLQKCGNTLTMAIMADYDGGPFKPNFTRTLPDLAKAGPFLNRSNSSIFVSLDGDRHPQEGPIWKALRLVVDGKSITPASSPTTQEVAPSTTRPAPADGLLAGEENLVRLNGKVPSFMVATKDPAFDANNGMMLRDNQLRTKQADFINHDFTFDVLFRTLDGTYGPVVGIGEYGHDGGRILNSVCGVSNGWERACVLLISGKEDVQLGQLPKSASGPHLFRMQKHGDTLTVGLCPSFAGKFEPLFLSTVPSLKSVSPFLNAKNAQLFITDGGTIDAVRLVVDDQAFASFDPQLSVPPFIVEGKPLHQAVAAKATGVQFQLETGPKGLELTPTGELSWTPSSDQIGRHELHVIVSRGKQKTAVQTAIEVVSAQDAAAVGGKLDQVALLHRLPLTSGAAHLTTGVDGRSMLLLDGDALYRLKPDGMSIQEKLKLPAKYVKLEERQDYFVALSDEKQSLDLLDKKTLQPIRSIRMNYQQRYDLALQPGKATCFVTVQTIVDHPRDVIVIVDEKTGDVREPDNFVGRWIRTSPDGRRLFAGYRASHVRSMRAVPQRPADFAAPEFDTVDLLLVYDISAAAPTLLAKKDAPGVNGMGIALAPDGIHIAYASASGYPIGSQNVPLFDSRDFTKRPIAYPTKENKASCANVAFHPTLPLAATPTATGALCFDRDTGDPQPAALKPESPPPAGTKIHRVQFSADGRNLLLFCEAEKGEWFIRRVQLQLSAAQVEKLKG